MTSESSSTASTPKGERRRAALVSAAAELLTEGGFEAIRHRAVADRAGLPLASTTYYFDSLDDLIAAAMEHYGRSELARGREQLARLSIEHRGVDTLVELVLDQLLGEDPDYEAVLLRYERLVATGRRPYLRPLMRTLAVELRELLTEIFVKSGVPIDPRRLEQLVALVDGAVVNALIEVNPDPRAAAARMLRDALS
ncbi:TetR family transcriptional regulator [Prauserella sp. PE36]|uniref:TetR family transcriptional regulator n=1 Tax=Prauserella endophytica TaxID=1592324 RepID=A0ABY2SC83_9PSEU|nr:MULTISPECIES: TetR family transcriptional regulator [Prauserella]PXY34572.1 TetR family transcriptional regulator [Prauserella coralliicola]RBM12970.1 TetR family transcriptional regulator [Prauserella sp. PE36]TKG73111.1 TetR family transcriptional regulator [Prauserella endophytica]